MKILLVSSTILPQSGGSSVIIENLAKNFSKNEMIVLGSKGLNQKKYERDSQNTPEFKYFFSELSLFGRGARFFDWYRKIRFEPLVEEIQKIILKEKISHVIGVYPNLFYCLAACRASFALNIPFFSYFHNTYTENTAITDPKAAVYQKEIFDNSRQIFVMSKGMQYFYEKKYRLNKFLPLVHTFNHYPQSTSNTKLPGSDKSKYKLVVIGNFNESNIDATRRLLDAIKNNPKYELSFYTPVPKILLQNRGLDVRYFHHKGTVNPEDIHEKLQQYDICILTHGFNGSYGEVEYQTIFPTRTIPFLLSGKPILVHSPEGSFLNNFIKEYQCAELIEIPQPDEIVAGLERITSNIDYQKELVTRAMNASKQFHSPKVISQLKEVLIKKGLEKAIIQ